jgi:hypothetical protein
MMKNLLITSALERKTHVRILCGFIAIALLLMSCNQSPYRSEAAPTEQFMSTLQGKQFTSTLESQTLGSALPDGNYLCVANGGKALGLILQGHTYQVAMSYENGHFFNWQPGEYSYTVTQANPKEKEGANTSPQGLPRTFEQDSGVVQWLSGPMTNWYKPEISATPVQFYGKTLVTLRRVNLTPYEPDIEESYAGEISFRVWETDATCSERNFVNFGGSW